jgi:hypothetical protein
MEFHGIEKLRGAENWHIWKFAVKNLLRGIEGAYEVCTGELLEPELVRGTSGTRNKAEDMGQGGSFSESGHR